MREIFEDKMETLNENIGMTSEAWKTSKGRLFNFGPRCYTDTEIYPERPLPKKPTQYHQLDRVLKQIIEHVKHIKTYIKPIQTYIKPIKTCIKPIKPYIKHIKTYTKPRKPIQACIKHIKTYKNMYKNI